METKTELQQEKALREQMRGERDVTPEDTLAELREDRQTVELRHQVRGVPGVAPEDTRSELLAKQQRAGEDQAEPSWRFANGFVDDSLYYAEGQRRYEEALAAGRQEEAEDISGGFNLPFQQHLSGFTLDSFGKAYDEAHQQNEVFDQLRIDEKDAGKANEYAAMIQERIDTASRWPLSEVVERVPKDTAALRAETSPWMIEAQLRDMGRFAEANRLYRAELEGYAPDIMARVEDLQLSDAAAVQKGKVPEQNQPAPVTATLAAEQDAQVDKALDAQLAEDLRQRKAREAAAQGQGENAVNVDKTGKELETGDFIMPRRIVQRYNEIDGKFFTKDAQRPMVMFEDKGDKLATSTTDRQAIEDMVTLAKAKQWESLKLSGSAEFRREGWLQAESQGIRTQGYTPKQADLAALEALREERTKNTITPIQERKQERQQQPQAEQAKAPRHDLNKNQAAMHDGATKAISANMAALQKLPALANRGDDELQKLAYWRGIVGEDNKGQPQGVKEEALARFDKAAENPQFLKQLNREASVQEVTTERVTTRVEVRDMPEQSL